MGHGGKQGIRPMTRTFTPGDEQQVAEAIAAALRDDAPLRIRAGGARARLGRPPAAQDVLDVSALAGVAMYEPEELVFTARAATPLADIEAMLAEHNQMLAFEPPDFAVLFGRKAGRGTLGGMTAVGLAGPRRIRAGSVRDHLLGFRAVSGRAEVFKSGGRVMKNVTGFDLSKLMCGSHGTLAVLTELTFKVLPAAERTITLDFPDLDEPQAQALMTKALQLPADVSAAAHLPAGVNRQGRAATLLRLEGFAASVAARRAMLEEALSGYGAPEMMEGEESRRIWRAIANVEPLAEPADHLIWRLVCPPAQGAQVAENLRAMLGDARLFMDYGGGLIWLAVPPAAHAMAELVRGALAAVSGHAMLFRAPPELRRALPVFQPQPEALAAVSERIRAAFDPADILNPGVIHPSAKREGTA